MGFVDSNIKIHPDCETEKEKLIKVEWRVNQDKNHINL